MGGMDRFYQRKKENKTPTTSGGGMNQFYQRKRYNSTDTSAVNDAYIDAFYNDWNSFSSSAEKDYGNLGWGNASSLYDSKSAAWQELSGRADVLAAYFYKNRNNFTDADKYASTVNGLNEIRSHASDILKSFQAEADYYSNFATEDEFNEWNKYSHIPEASDFAEKSKYVSTYRGGEKFSPITGTYLDTGFDDIMYDFINRNETAASRKGLDNIASGSAFLGFDNRERREMTDDEISIFNYIYATQGKDAAYEYVDHITAGPVGLNARQREKETEAWESYAKESPVGSSIFSVLEAPLKGLSYIGQAADYISDGKIDQNAGYNKFSYINSAIRNQVTQDVEKNWGGVGSFAYQTGMSMADFLFTTAVSGGNSALSLGIMGTGAAADTVIYAKDRGLSDTQAFALGTIAGAAEIVTEKISLDTLLDATQLGKNALGYIAKNMLAEGSEEVFSSAINLIADVMISRDKSEWREAIEAYKAVGMSDNEAFWHAVGDQALSLGLDFLGGAISGGVMGGGGATLGAINTAVQGSGMKGAGIDADLTREALEINPGNRYAQKMQGKVDSGKALSSYQLGKLVQQNETEMYAQDKAKIKSAVEARLTELGETGDVARLADVITKAQAGETLTRSENAVLNSSQNAQQVFSELDPENSESDWTGKIGTDRINAEAYGRLIAEMEAQPAPQTEAQTEPQAEAVPATENESTEANATEGEIKAPAEVKQMETATMLDGEGNEVSVTPVKFAEIGDGEATLELEGGQTVKADSVAFKNSGVGFVYQAATEMALGVGGFNLDAANVMVRGISPDISEEDASLYVAAFNEAYRYGAMGYPSSALESRWSTAFLSEKQRETAYSLGKIYGEGKVAEKQAKIDSIVSKNASENANKPRKKGKIYFDGSAVGKTLTERQRASLKGLRVVAEAMGVDIHIFQSEVVDNVRQGANGWYDPSTKEIHLDLHAGIDGNGLMLYTASHELTHHIKNISPAKFKAFSDALLEEYTKNGISIDRLVASKQKFLDKKGRTDGLTEEQVYDLALEEVVADACEAMLVDSGAIEAFSRKIKSKNKSLWETIKEFIAKLVSRIREAYKGVDPDSVEGKLVREMKDSAERLQKLWVEAALDAAEAYPEVAEALGKGASLEVNEKGEFTVGHTKDGTLLYNDRTYEEGGRETLEKTLREEGFSEDDIWAALVIMDAKHDLVERLGEEFVAQGEVNRATIVTDVKHGHSALSALVKNGDYPVNIDLSTVCKKRQAYQRVINRLCESGLIKQATLDSLAIAEINKILGKHGFETACLGCFVESKRLRIQEYAQTVCKEWNSLVDKKVGKENAKDFGFAKDTFVTDLTEEDIDRLTEEYEKAVTKEGNVNVGTGSYLKKFEKLMDSVPSLQKRLTVSDIATPKGMANLKSVSPELFALVASRYGSGTPKPVQSFNPYNSELAVYGSKPKKYSSLREYLYAIGGARMQSFSDFIVENWFDYCQIVADLTARKLPMHTYTKEITLAKLFGMTGIKVNMSLIPDIDTSLGSEYAGLTKNANGEYELIWSDKDRYKATGGKSYMQSINFADAVALQSDPRYSANVGTIAIGISDNHIRVMLDDSRIRMIIPYHKSNINPIFAKLSGIDYYKDYTDVQSTTVKELYDSNGKKADISLTKKQKEDLTAGFEFNEALQRLGDARAAAREYIEWCADSSLHTITIGGETYTATLTPKFEAFSDHANYYKLLEDFNTYDNITEQAAPQGDVQQIYPEDFEQILRDELKARENYSKKQEPKWETAMGEIEDYLKTHTKAETKAYAKANNLKLKFSDRDSDGKTLSKEQQEFFKDSKVRDKEGKLMVVYHGTANGGAFTVFDGDKLGNESRTTQIGQGFYFTNAKNEAKSYMKNVDIYGKASKGSNPHLHQVYLNIKNPFYINQDQLDLNKVKAVYSDGTYDYFFNNWIPFYLNKKTVNGRTLTKDEIQSMSKAEKVSEYVDYLSSGGAKEVLSNMVRAFPYGKQGELLTAMKKHLGFDGIVEEFSPGQYQYVAFDSNQVKATTNKTPTKDSDIRYSDRVTDKETLDFLNDQLKKGEVTKVYRAMQVQPVDESGNVIKAAVLRVVSQSPLMVEAKTFGKNGKTDIYPAKLFSPMAGMINGKWGKNIELNAWEETSFDLAHATTVIDEKTGKPKIDTDKKNASYGETAYFYGLVKGGIDNNGKKLTPVPARYNPYIHTSLSALNDQFSSANKRPELVTVECIVPNSELTSGFRAEGAKDRVGAMSWHSGPTSSRLAQIGKARTVILTRYDMPIRVLPDSEVAQAVADYIGDSENIAIKESTVTPSLSTELRNLGVSVLNEEEWAQYDKDFPTKTFGKNNKKSNDVRYSDRDSYAPTFYSHMSKVIDDVKLEKMGSASILNHLKNRGVKAEEIKWSGIEAFLEGKKSVTKAELQLFVACSQLRIEEENWTGGPNITLEPSLFGGDEWEVMLGGEVLDTYSWSDEYELYISDNTGDGFKTKERLLEYFKEKYGSGGTRWSRYKLSGGENYREIIFRMLNATHTNPAMRLHWGREAEGILVHARIQDFVTSDGKQMLFVEEIQSDWHNEGAKDGYLEKGDTERLERLKAKAEEAFFSVEDYSTEMTGSAGKWDTIEKTEKGKQLLGAYREAQGAYDNAMNVFVQKIPDAPFRDNYYEYVMKRLIRMAAEDGYDSIGWTPAKIQSERWSEEYAEAYRIEYDQNIPKFLRKYGKKWGATVGKSTVEGTDVWSMDITDSMKDSVLYEGQVLYSDRDSDGNKLSAEQQEFFKDSKARDENGNLKVMYHGTSKGGFYSFDTYGSNYGLFGQGSYFTDNEDVAESYTKKGRGTRPQIYKTYLNIKNPIDMDAEAKPIEWQNAFPDIDFPNRGTNEEFYRAMEQYFRDEMYTKWEAAETATYGIIDMGYDGITHIGGGRYNKDDETRHRVFIAFEPEQIKSVDNIRPTSDTDIRYSDRDIKPITEAEVKELEQHFGTTGNFRVAGYLLTDGKLLDFSGKHWGDTTSRSRQVDHRDVGEVLNRGNNGVSDMVDMIGSGNIRLMPETGGINLAVYPNEKQRRVLSTYINYMLATEGQVLIDYDAVGGDTVYSREYGKTASSRQILTDIRNYFNGARQSELMQFHTMYSDRQTDSFSNRSLLAGALETAAQNDIERTKLEQYKEKIDRINSEEKKLHELRAQIKKLSFEKGPRDTEALKNLQFKANQTANRINVYDRQLLNLESTKALKGVLEREKKLAYQKAEKRGKEALEAQREREAKTRRELMDRYRESRQRSAENRYKTAVRHKIKGVVNSLNSYLLSGTKEKHVPIGLQSAVAEALDAVNMDTVGAEERIAQKRAEMMRAQSPEEIEKLVKEVERLEEMGGNMAAKLERLKTAYDDILNSDDPIIANSYDEVISNTISNVIKEIGDTSLRDMNLHQLEAVYDMYKMILTTVRNANKAFKAHKSEEISTIANQVIAELDGQKKKKKLQSKAGEVISSFDWNNQKPVYAFERIGSDTFTDVFSSVREGEDVWARDMTEAQAFLEEQKKKYNYKSWEFDKRYAFASSTGRDFSLSLGQIMSLYAYSKRGPQAKEHLKYGGFVFDGITEVKEKGKVRTKTYKLKDSTAYNLSEGILENIISRLTEEQKNFADATQDYLSTVMGEKGNEVSLALYDVKLFKEKHYFPLKSAPQFLERAREQANGDVKIKNKGFTKETTPKAKNPIVLTSFMDVWTGHVNEMSMYHAFALPLEDFYRVYNYKSPASETLDSDSVISYLENAHGNASVSYIDQLLKDLNGGARSDPRETFTKAMMANFKKASVMASLSVVIQQPSAIVRAQALVAPKHFVGKKISKGKHKALWEEIKQYAPVAIIKEMGYFDTGMGKSSAEWLKGEKAWKDKVDDVTSFLPGWADEVTWVAIWNAVKRETAAKNTELATSSEEFLKMAGERFTEVIVMTQVYDSVLSRSANMRSKSAFMNMLTAFMAEPTTSINMLQNAFLKGDKKTVARTTGAVLGSVLLNSALVSLIYAARDDDEDESWWEKYLSRLTTEVIDGVNPVTYLPFVKDIWSAAQGFDVERADMTLITKLFDSLQQTVKVIGKDTSNMDEEALKDHKKAVTGSALSIVDDISSLLGIPVKNIRRDINGAINFIKTLVRGDKATAGSLGDNILDDVKDSVPVWGWLPDESKGDKLYDAIIRGDAAYVERLKSGYKSESSYESAIRKALRENDPRIKEAAELRFKGDIAGYMKVAKAIIAEGHFKQDDIVAAINAEMGTMGEKSESEPSDKAVSLYKVDDYYKAITNGDSASAYAVKYDLIETDIANGKDRDEAEKKFNSDLTSYIQDEFKKGNITDYKARDMLSYAGKTAEEAASKIQYWSFKKNYPDYDLSESAVSDWYSDVKPSGISLSVYYDYTKESAKATGVDNNGDGKADSGTKKSEILQIIHSLPISSYQKDVLYRLNGWAESTLYQAPWH